MTETSTNEICPVCNNPIEADQQTCATCGYHFLGSTQKFKPVDVSSEDIVANTKKSSANAQLHVVRGPQIAAIFTLDEKPLTIGRSPQCEIFLNDMTVSRQHATVELTDEGHKITDLNSYNGVWVDNNNVESYVLKEGDIVQIGAFCLTYQKDA